jgi:integrase
MSRKAAEAERDRILEPLNAGLAPSNSSMMSLSDFIDTVFLEVKKAAKRWREDSTAPTSRGILDNHLKPTLGVKLIHLITRRELQDLLNQKASAGFSYSIVQHLHSFMTEIFEMPLADRLIPLNPARTVVIPRCKDPKPKPTMNSADIKRLEQGLDIRERLIVRLAITGGGGMRPGEIEGLKLGDVREDRIFIRRRVYRGKEGEPKTRKSNREVPLLPRTSALLKEYRKLLIHDHPDAWLFPSENVERPLDYRNVFYRKIRPALVRIGLGKINYQAMRRTFASAGKGSGMDPKTRSDIMGHTVDVNENVYPQTPFDAKKRAMQKMEKRLLQ